MTSKDNILQIRFYAEVPAIDSKFEILYTAFRDKPIGQGTYTTMLMCSFGGVVVQ